MQAAFIRHLPTAWNHKCLLQGKQNIPLTKISPQQRIKITENKRQLNKLQPFDRVLTSQLQRTRQTATAYGCRNTICEPLLDELDFGSFEGKPRRSLMKHCQHEWLYNPANLKLGESLIDFEQRINDFLKRYQAFERILVFGHGSWIRAVLSIHKHGHINRMNQLTVNNNELTLLEFKDTVSLGEDDDEKRSCV